MICLVVSLLLYGLIYFAAEQFSGIIGIPHIITAVAVPIYVLLQMRLVYRHSNLTEYGISGICEWKAVLSGAAPIAILPIINVLPYRGCLNESCIKLESLADILLSIYAGFCEEWLFRGILPTVLQRCCKITRFLGVCVASVFFAGLHAVNALASQSSAFVWLQVAVAFGVGFCFAGLTEQAGSIFPAAILHILINLTSFVHEESTPFGLWQYVWILVSVACGCYGIWLFQYSRRKKQYETIH